MDIRTPGAHVFRFGVFELDTTSGELRRHGLKIRFPDQSFQILKGLLQELEAHRREQYVSSFGIALIHDALGEMEPALAALQRGYREHAVEFGLRQYPPFKTIASQPQFQAVMQEVGMAR